MRFGTQKKYPAARKKGSVANLRLEGFDQLLLLRMFRLQTQKNVKHESFYLVNRCSNKSKELFRLRKNKNVLFVDSLETIPLLMKGYSKLGPGSSIISSTRDPILFRNLQHNLSQCWNWSILKGWLKTHDNRAGTGTQPGLRASARRKTRSRKPNTRNYPGSNLVKTPWAFWQAWQDSIECGIY